eukprot:scaffold13262_cov122-Cylindrotheca_fusiformis.AAC.1
MEGKFATGLTVVGAIFGLTGAYLALKYQNTVSQPYSRTTTSPCIGLAIAFFPDSRISSSAHYFGMLAFLHTSETQFHATNNLLFPYFKGAALNVRPSVSNDTVLTSREFMDALLIRYGFPLQLPSSCDGCGGNFTLHHALSCNSGGLIIQRHDEVKWELVQLAQRVYPPSAVRDEPFIHAVSMPKANSTDCPSDAALSARGDILIRNMFSNGSETIIDVSL